MTQDNAPYAIEFKSIIKTYAENMVLDHVSYSVEAGEFVGLVGVNGAGKTTMIKSLLDLTNIDSGEIQLFGVDHCRTEARSRLAYLPERFNPPTYLKGDDFIKYMLELHCIEYDKSKIESILSQLDFDVEKLSKYVRSYSKGMVQKLGLAAAFLSTKPLLIFDEPMSGLDPKARMHLKDYFASLKNNNFTLFISTHLLADAALICDRLIILHNMKIIFQGTPKLLLERYSSNDYDEAFVNCISTKK